MPKRVCQKLRRALHRLRQIAPVYLAAAMLLLAIAGRTWAHQAAGPPPTPAEIAEVESPLPGSEQFTQEVVEHLRGQFDEPALNLLDQMQAESRQRDQIRWGGNKQSNQSVADYHRWRAEKILLELLDKHQTVVTLDFREGHSRPSSDDQLSLDPQVDVLLLKVVVGDGPVAFCVQPWDLVAEYPHTGFTVDIERGGTTYVMLKLTGVPHDENGSLLGFHERGSDQAPFWHVVKFAAREWGQLAIDVRDQQGHPMPVLFRLSSHVGQRLWEPAGAVDLRSVLNEIVPHLSLLGRGYMFWLPGDNRGRYWIVPRLSEMTLPAGDWDLRLIHGPEYEPIAEMLHVEAGRRTERTYHLNRWINMPAQGWYSGDDHVHARLLNGEDAENLLNYARAADIHVANILEMGDHLRTYYPQRGFGPDSRVHAGDHWLVPGQEDPRSILGHAIGLNLDAKVRDVDRYLLNDWVAGEIHRQGGLYGHTHVGANALFANREMAIFTPLGIVDFNSIMQASLGTELYYDLLNLGFKMTASAGADTPYGGTVGAVRAYAFAGREQPFTPDRWFEAVRRGRTFVTNGPMLDFHVGDALPGDEIAVDGDETLNVRAVARGLKGRSSPRQLRLVRFGETFAEKSSSDPQLETLELATTLAAGEGCWIAAHAVGHDGSEAHTTPVYVSRRGFRHWKSIEVERLIAKELAILDETESALEDSRRVVAENPSSLDYWNRLNAAQADQVRLRLDQARNSYRELQKTLVAEQRHRPAPAASGQPENQR